MHRIKLKTEKRKKIVNLVKLKVLLNPNLQKLLNSLNKCKTPNCRMCREMKAETGIITNMEK